MSGPGLTTVREWRKVHSSIASSDRLASVSYEARWLFVLLLLAQDDTGFYPWTLIMVRRLLVTTNWDNAEATFYMKELVEIAVVSWKNGGVLIRRGAELNGHPRKDVTPLRYERGTSTSRQRDVNAHVTQSREERVEKKETPTVSPPKSRHKPITPEFIEELVVKMAPVLGGEADVRRRIEKALNDKGLNRAISKRLYLTRWLERDVGYQKKERQNGTHPAKPPTQPDRKAAIDVRHAYEPRSLPEVRGDCLSTE